MCKIYALIDYNGNFESKFNSIPYRSGMDKKLLKEHFKAFGFEVVFIEFSEVINYENAFWENKLIIYTSSEDTGYYYKSFIEDVVYYLELSKAKVIPSYKYLKANNNKVFMELLRFQMDNNYNNFQSRVFGALEVAEKNSNMFKYPIVYKEAAGAKSNGVGLINSQKELKKKLKKASGTANLFRDFWEFGRSIKYNGYKKESKYLKKFILQNFIEGFEGDYKILIFSNKIFVLKRGAKQGDFRASGSGLRSFVKELPEGLLQFTYDFYRQLDVPNASIDVAYNGKEFYVVEFQCVFFGSFTLTYSDFYWQRNGLKFELIEMKSELEEVYTNSIINYLRNK
jgi:glutathione synthase/RimK-type ligase-like ATP-grasp enzyme